MRDIANGDLNQEIPVENLDEFGEIARYMNQMERHVKGSDGDGNGKRNVPKTIW